MKTEAMPMEVSQEESSADKPVEVDQSAETEEGVNVEQVEAMLKELQSQKDALHAREKNLFELGEKLFEETGRKGRSKYNAGKSTGNIDHYLPYSTIGQRIAYNSAQRKIEENKKAKRDEMENLEDLEKVAMEYEKKKNIINNEIRKIVEQMKELERRIEQLNAVPAAEKNSSPEVVPEEGSGTGEKLNAAEILKEIGEV